MKKVVLSLLAACAATAAFSQANVTSLNQNGNANNSNTNQYGQRQTANITQNGENNINTNEQFSNYTQVTNVNQQGNFNSADTKQNNNAGPQNFINVNQFGNGDANTRNRATVDQSAYYTISSTANVNQRGNNQNATIRQIGAQNDVATIDQGGYGSNGVGSNQTATISQGNADAVNSSSNSTAYIQQLSTYSQFASISQLGNNNKGTIYQNDNAGPNDVATINQNGNDNVAQINQSDFETAFGTEGTINQKGNRNTAYLDQIGTTGNFTNGSFARITQNGDDNQTRFHQDGGVNNRATINQSGNFNTVEGLGGAGSFAVQNGGGNNTLNIDQVSPTGGVAGQGQKAMVSQVGSNNVGTISQAYFFALP